MPSKDWQIALGDKLNINLGDDIPPIVGNLSIRARMLEVGADRLLRLQIDFAAYCRAQAALQRAI
jgi:hypothetical protein